MLKKMITASLMLLFAISIQAAEPVQFVNHDIFLSLNVPDHKAEIDCGGELQLKTGTNYFFINKTADIASFTLDKNEVEYKFITDTTGLNLGEVELSPQAALVVFEADEAGQRSYKINFTATFFDDVANIRFSNENVGREVNGTIFEKGAYLSPSAFYYPSGSEKTANFKLTADIPESWESVSDGNSTPARVEEIGRKIQTWENPFVMDGCMFMAAPYVSRSVDVGSVKVYCYFFAEDTALIDGYLEATVDYMKMYTDLIGPYPYERFTVAENFFPTGYGMPGWTLLGQQVLRLPFIKFTSLGHEVLHNWWGNSVYVDYARGNWCESATVYGADYRYKLMKSPDDAKDYRKNILKQYNSYVNESNDFPIREFTSRTSPNTRTIGYNKAMMVYHMIAQKIGDDKFFETWKEIYKRYQAKPISWEEWLTTFEEVSGADLSYFIPQWIDRAGAPILAVEIIDQKVIENAGVETTIKISQTGEEIYNLDIPVRMYHPSKISFDVIVPLAQADTTITIVAPDNQAVIMIDPDYHIFRQLYPSEIEPIISGVMGIDNKRFITGVTDSTALASFTSFGNNLNGSEIEVSRVAMANDNKEPFTPIVFNVDILHEYLQDKVVIHDDSITVNKITYPKENHTFILTMQDKTVFEKGMVVLSDDYESLPRVGQLVPHYGKYSYLVFKGSRNIGKGQWPTSDSPLNVPLSDL